MYMRGEPDCGLQQRPVQDLRVDGLAVVQGVCDCAAQGGSILQHRQFHRRRCLGGVCHHSSRAEVTSCRRVSVKLWGHGRERELLDTQYEAIVRDLMEHKAAGEVGKGRRPCGDAWRQTYRQSERNSDLSGHGKLGRVNQRIRMTKKGFKHD